MPGQSLLKATLLKETYGQLIDLNGAERNHAVRVLPSRFSSKERMFLNLIAPNGFPVKEHQQRAGLPGARFYVKDLVNVYEKLIADANKSNSYTKVGPIDEEFEFLTNQLCDQVSTPKVYLPKSPSNGLGIDRSVRPSWSPAEALSSYRTAIFQEVMCELEERSQFPSCYDTEQPNGIRLPSASQGEKGMQRKGFNPRSCSTGDENAKTEREREPTPRTAGGAANGEQTSLILIEKFDHVTFQTVSDERNHNTGVDAYDHKSLNVQSLKSGSTEGVRIEAELAISSGSSEVSDCDRQPSARSHGDSHRSIEMSSEMCGESRSTEESTVTTLSWRCYSKSAVSSDSTSCTLSMPSTGSKTIDNPDDKIVNKIMATVINLTVDTEGEKANFAKQLQAQKGAEETIEEELSHENSTARSFRQHMPLDKRNSDRSLIELSRRNSEEVHSSNRRSSKDDDDVQILQATEGDAKGQRSSIMRSEEFKVIPDQNVRIERNHNTDACEQQFNKEKKSGADRANVDDKRHFPSGWYEGSDSNENPSAKSHGDNHWRRDTLYEMFGKSRSMKERTAFQSARQNFSGGWPEVSMSDQTSSAKSPGDSHKPLARPSEWLRRSQTMKETTVCTARKQELSEVSERFGKSRSTIDRTAVTAAWQNSLDSSPTTTVSSGNRSWKLAMPTMASKTVQKLQKMLGKATRIQPVVDTEREKANSVLQAQDRKSVRSSLRNELLHDNSNSSSLSQVPPSPEISHQEGQKLSLLVRMLKKILGRRKCEVRINVVGAWLDDVDWTIESEDDGDITSSHPSLLWLPFETCKSPRQERESRRTSDWLFTGSPPQRSSHQRASPKRRSARSPRSSPKRNADDARHKKPHKFEVVSPRRSASREYGIDTASPVHLTGGSNERPIGVPRTAISNVEEADMDYSGAHNRTWVGQPRVWAEDSKSPELWRHPIVDNRKPPRSTCSRFRREYIARQRNSRQLSTLLQGN